MLAPRRADDEVMLLRAKGVIWMCEPVAAGVWYTFAEYICALLGVDITILLHIPGRHDGANDSGLNRSSGRSRLILLPAPEPTWLQRAFGISSVNRFLRQVRTPVLVARRPRWPFHHLLLVLRDEPTDVAAMAWTLHVAASGDATITILPLALSQPKLYNRMGDRAQPEAAALLAPNTPMGQKVHKLFALLLSAGIPGHVRYGRGAPELQIREALADGNHDLLVMGAEAGGRLSRWFLGELAPSLLRDNDYPVLLAC